MKNIGIAEVKRRFAELLGQVRYQGERLIVMRRRQPMAAIVPLEDLRTLESGKHGTSRGPRPGLLVAIGAWEDYEELDRIVEDIYRSRKTASGRTVEISS